MYKRQVIDDPDARDAAPSNRHFNPRGPGIERILDQFLDHGGRALDHFTGSHLAGDVFWKQGDSGHGAGSLPWVPPTFE